jgi:molybdate transport system substrate-binding protein
LKRYLISVALVAAMVLANSHGARAQDEITVLAPGSIRQALGQLAPAYEQKTGQKVKVTFGSGAGTKKQAAQGDAFDVIVLQPPYPEVLASGNVVNESATPLATVSIGVAVRKGAAKPDISTADAVKRMLLAASSIAYPDPAGAASGVSVNDAFKKLGIAEQLQPKIKLAMAPLTLVAKGDAEIALAYLVDMNDPGVDVVGPLPRDVSTPTAFVGFVSAHAKDAAAAKALLDYLASPEAAPVYTAKGMQPGS